MWDKIKEAVLSATGFYISVAGNYLILWGVSCTFGVGAPKTALYGLSVGFYIVNLAVQCILQLRRMAK